MRSRGTPLLEAIKKEPNIVRLFQCNISSVNMASGIVRAGFAEVVSAQEFALDAPRCAKARADAQRVLETSGESGKVDVFDDFSEELVRNLYVLLHSLPHAQVPNLFKTEKHGVCSTSTDAVSRIYCGRSLLRNLTWTV